MFCVCKKRNVRSTSSSDFFGACANSTANCRSPAETHPWARPSDFLFPWLNPRSTISSCAVALHSFWISGGCESDKCTVISGRKVAVSVECAEVNFSHILPELRILLASKTGGRFIACCFPGKTALKKRAKWFVAKGLEESAPDHRPTRSDKHSQLAQQPVVPSREPSLPFPCQA